MNLAECIHAQSRVQFRLCDADLRIHFLTGIASAIIQIPGSKQITEGQRIIVIRTPAGEYNIELAGRHLRQPLFEDLHVDSNIQTQVLLIELLIVLRRE